MGVHQFGGPSGQQMCPRYVDFDGFIALFWEKKYDFNIKLLSNQDGAWVGEQLHFCWKIKYFGLFNIHFVSLQCVCGLEIVVKVKINVQNTTIQGFYTTFWKKS